MSDLIFSLLLETNGNRAVQIHLRNAAFTNLASVNSINGARASCISLDMVYDKLYSKYHTYIIVKPESTGNQVQLIEVIFNKQQLSEPKPSPEVKLFKDMFNLYPNNCGDKLRAT